MIRLGILGAAEIAFRRFMPAVNTLRKDILPVVVAEEYNQEKLNEFCNSYNIEGSRSFKDIIGRKDIDAVYIPQPPALHYKWAKMALDSGKHVLVEKPSTTSYGDSNELVNLARKNELALHENYMFKYHSQIRVLKELVDKRIIGETRIIRANFAFPFRTTNDFRYNKHLGGGALLDAGGYTVKLLTIFLGNDVKVKSSTLNISPEYNVDISGSATLENSEGLVGQIYFSMDSFYQCSIEIIGQTGRIYTNRVFTAPPDLSPVIIIEKQGSTEKISVEPDSHFRHSIENFVQQVNIPETRAISYNEILLQASLVENIREKSLI